MVLDRRRRRLNREGMRAEDYEEWRTEVGWEYNLIEAATRAAITEDLREEAERLRLPVHAQWDYDTHPAGEAVWTREAIAELKEAIRKEKRERRETIGWWLRTVGTLVTILTGLVGALIGLISLWRHR